MHNLVRLVTGALASAFMSLTVQGDDGQQIISLQMENDLFLGFTDQEYTNGFRLNYIYTPDRVPGTVEKALSWIPLFPEGGKRRFSLALGQNIYTPSDIEVSGLLANERPYAGYLYLGFGVASESKRHVDVLELDVGIVGPAALGEEIQKFVHRNISNSPDPEGWEHQLRNEPAFVMHYQRIWRPERSGELLGAKWDFSPHAGMAIGTVFTHATAGATLRLGTDLKRDIGAPPRIQPNLPGNDMYVSGDRDAFYVFIGTEARAVAHNMFLDGSLFRDGHSVGSKPFTAEIYMGAVLFVNDWKFAYTQVFRTDEYSGQERHHSYGGFVVSRQF